MAMEKQVILGNPSLPVWVETGNLSDVSIPCNTVSEDLKKLAGAVGLFAERFIILAEIGDCGSIIEPETDCSFVPLSAAPAVTLLALVRAFFSYPVVTNDGTVLPQGGFAKAPWLAAQIERLTNDTKLLFSPSEEGVRIAIMRLRNALHNCIKRECYIQTLRLLGYRLRVWPSLITVIIYNGTVS